MIVAGTGHRPHKLGGYDRATEIKCIRLALGWLKKHEIDSVISGMALGWDQALAEAALLLRIPLLAYLPCRNMDRHWTTSARDRWVRILNRAAVVYVADTSSDYSMWGLQKRNEMMVDDCTHLLALWEGSDGGTANCLGYRQRKHPTKPWTNLWLEWLELNKKPA